MLIIKAIKNVAIPLPIDSILELITPRLLIIYFWKPFKIWIIYGSSELINGIFKSLKVDFIDDVLRELEFR